VFQLTVLLVPKLEPDHIKYLKRKKQGKKEPAKTMKEKRAAKKAKKEGKGGMR